MMFKIAFVGGGNMATSLIHGLIQSGFPSQTIRVADPNPEKRAHLKQQFAVQCFETAKEAIDDAKIIVLAVKPQHIKGVAEELQFSLQNISPLIISIATGITTSYLRKVLGDHLPIVRAMPNTPALLEAGATGLYADGKVTEEQQSLAESILRSVGITVWVNHEHDMDTITALSGSGPAYFFRIMQALEQGAIELGLSRNDAKILTLQTALGAARMAMESEISLEQLITKISVKGGTTERALAVLESSNIQKILKDALQAAKERSEEISRSFE